MEVSITSEDYSEIIEACHSAVYIAQETYEKVSGGNWLYFAPEYYLTSALFDEIGSIDGILADLEAGVKNTIVNAGAHGQGRLKSSMRPNGQCDLLLWHENLSDEDGEFVPTIPIEVKKDPFDASTYLKDITRLTDMIDRKSDSSSIQAGIFVFYQSASSKKNKSSDVRLKEKRIQKLNRIKEQIDSDKFVVETKTKTFIIDDEDERGTNSWSSSTVFIYLRESEVS